MATTSKRELQRKEAEQARDKEIEMLANTLTAASSMYLIPGIRWRPPKRFEAERSVGGSLAWSKAREENKYEERGQNGKNFLRR